MNNRPQVDRLTVTRNLFRIVTLSAPSNAIITAFGSAWTSSSASDFARICELYMGAMREFARGARAVEDYTGDHAHAALAQGATNPDDARAISVHIRRLLTECARLDACLNATVCDQTQQGVALSLRRAAAACRDALLWSARQSFATEEATLATAYGCSVGERFPGPHYQRALAEARERHAARIATIGVMLDAACATVPGVVER